MKGNAKDLRLAESTLPLRQISLDSVHEKNVRHGHISTLHIWPARRPLAASRAMLLATLLPDPGDSQARRRLGQRMAGNLVPKRLKGGGEDPELKETSGGILHWGCEGGPELVRFRDEIRAAFGGRMPRVLDPFAGGGAIPLEAMRLGCETLASDLNPVAWFILRCTLHYPRLVAGEDRPLPEFALRDRGFAAALVKSRGARTKIQIRNALARLGHQDGGPVQLSASVLEGESQTKADFAWHLRAWGLRVLDNVRRKLASRYPTWAEFEPIRRQGRRRSQVPANRPYQFRPPHLLEPGAGGRVSVKALNAEFDSLYLENEANPRWVAKPVVANLWARTAECGGCRAEVPLLKTRWLCKKTDPVKRVLLTMRKRPNGEGIDFGVEAEVPQGSGSVAQKRAHDKTLGAGTISGSGVECPSCGSVTKLAELRAQGRAGRLGARMTAVVVDGQAGKEYRVPTEHDIDAAKVSREELDALYARVPFGIPDEPISPDRPSPNARGASGLPRYGLDTWGKLFTNRQLLVLGMFVREIRAVQNEMSGYPEEWRQALWACLALTISRLADRGSSLATWTNARDTIRSTFARFALPMVWDFAESSPLVNTTGGFIQAVQWTAKVVDHTLLAVADTPVPEVAARSATAEQPGDFDLICTDPPYYDAIPYSDLMDFFHIWLRRVVHGLSPETDAVFRNALGPKWSREEEDGEIVDQPGRWDGDVAASKTAYEDGMYRAFRRCHKSLRDDGRFVVVFANKNPDAWETLSSALVRAGFTITASWPIQTEMPNKVAGGARLSSSIWLVCRKRPATARPGWEGTVLQEMRGKITRQLRDFWDAGIRGPDFVWAATGPALEAFSRHPIVKRADRPGERLTVAEFLRSVRRMVVGFVVSRLLSRANGATTEMDDLTTYYLLHRSDFGMGAAPAGACILYALSCNLSDADLSGRRDLLVRGNQTSANDSEDDSEDAPALSGSDARLKTWKQRRALDLGRPNSSGTAPALIDCVHKLMQLWKTGEQGRVNSYLEERGLWKHDLFAAVVQAVLELAERGSEERAVLESLQNHLLGGGRVISAQGRLL